MTFTLTDLLQTIPVWDAHLSKLTPSTCLAQEAQAPVLTTPLANHIPILYHSHLDRFEKKAAERFPESRPYDHSIDLKPDFQLQQFSTYQLSLAEKKELDHFLDENLRKGYICPSQSSMASPFFFVAKKDGRLQPCQDYHYLNEGTVKNTYPFPLIAELIDKLVHAQWFTKLDLRSGYNNVQIREGDQ